LISSPVIAVNQQKERHRWKHLSGLSRRNNFFCLAIVR
jgi:hypothetical protein